MILKQKVTNMSNKDDEILEHYKKCLLLLVALDLTIYQIQYVLDEKIISLTLFIKPLNCFITDLENYKKVDLCKTHKEFNKINFREMIIDEILEKLYN